jgi:hypothetical protein
MTFLIKLLCAVAIVSLLVSCSANTELHIREHNRSIDRFDNSTWVWLIFKNQQKGYSAGVIAPMASVNDLASVFRTGQYYSDHKEIDRWISSVHAISKELNTAFVERWSDYSANQAISHVFSSAKTIQVPKWAFPPPQNVGMIPMLSGPGLRVVQFKNSDGACLLHYYPCVPGAEYRFGRLVWPFRDGPVSMPTSTLLDIDWASEEHVNDYDDAVFAVFRPEDVPSWALWRPKH